MEGWIKLHRKFSEKAFYSKDSEKVHLWIHLLIKANHNGYEELLGGKPIICNPGQFTTGRKQLSNETGISESKIERILTYFEKIEQQIEQRKTSVNRLISIINWNEYQKSEQQIEQRVNNDRTTSEQRVNTLQECKNIRIKEYKNILLSEIKISDFTEIKENHFKIALSFQELIKKNILRFGGITTEIEKTKGSAINDIRFLFENRKFDRNDFLKVYEFLEKDEINENGFSWAKTVQSISGLRKHFNKILIQAKNNGNNGKRTVQRNTVESNRESQKNYDTEWNFNS